MKVTVTLVRGEKKTLSWEHPNLQSAMCRAHALADFHSTIISTTKPNELVVDASNYYRR